MTQEELMVKDECIVVDNDDRIIGHASKKDTHVFSPKQPRGVLHRAFSVFLFDSDGKLLLQQRAADKITFPNVWTNTCCSHPLYGYSPSEADDEAALVDGSVPGVKAAAVRKLLHELGIKAKDVPVSKFKVRVGPPRWLLSQAYLGPPTNLPRHMSLPMWSPVLDTAALLGRGRGDARATGAVGRTRDRLHSVHSGGREAETQPRGGAPPV